jgi:hypothetical protein
MLLSMLWYFNKLQDAEDSHLKLKWEIFHLSKNCHLSHGIITQIKSLELTYWCQSSQLRLFSKWNQWYIEIFRITLSEGLTRQSWLINACSFRKEIFHKSILDRVVIIGNKGRCWQLSKYRKLYLMLNELLNCSEILIITVSTFLWNSLTISPYWIKNLNINSSTSHL